MIAETQPPFEAASKAVRPRRPRLYESGLFLVVVVVPLAFLPFSTSPFGDLKLLALAAGCLGEPSGRVVRGARRGRRRWRPSPSPGCRYGSGSGFAIARAFANPAP